MDTTPLRNPRFLLIAGGVILVLLVVIFALLNGISKKIPAETSSPIAGKPDSVIPTSTSSVLIREGGEAPEPGIIAKVGNEYLYDSDLNYELTYYPASNSGQAERILFNKLIEDSILLQEGEKKGLISLDSTIYNSKTKNYEKRISSINTLKATMEKKSATLKGTVVAIWFHNGKPGSIGYEAGKELALSKITQLQNDVAANKLTVQQAGLAIQNDSQLAQVDSSYKANAIFDFDVSADQKITFSQQLDTQIRAMGNGEVSQVLTGQDLDPLTGKQIDAVYMIAKITEKTDSADLSLDAWLQDMKKQYEVIRY